MHNDQELTLNQCAAIMELFCELQPKAPASVRAAEMEMEDAFNRYMNECELGAFSWGFTLGKRFAKLPEDQARILMQFIDSKAIKEPSPA